MQHPEVWFDRAVRAIAVAHLDSHGPLSPRSWRVGADVAQLGTPARSTMQGGDLYIPPC
jgi:hypothetical protein